MDGTYVRSLNLIETEWQLVPDYLKQEWLEKMIDGYETEMKENVKNTIDNLTAKTFNWDIETESEFKQLKHNLIVKHELQIKKYNLSK